MKPLTETAKRSQINLSFDYVKRYDFQCRLQIILGETDVGMGPLADKGSDIGVSQESSAGAATHVPAITDSVDINDSRG
jgi:hypothetical protein